MKIPKTSEMEPYIEFRFDKKGNLKLSTTNSWRGGINSGFSSSSSEHGNTAPPKQLAKYILTYVKRQIEKENREIKSHQKKLERLEKLYTKVNHELTATHKR